VSPDDDEFRRRAIRAALTVAAIAVVFGLVVGGLTAGAIYLTGVLPDEPARPLPTPEANDENSIPSPSLSPTSTPSPTSSPSPSPSKTARPSPTPTKPSQKPSPTRSRKPRPSGAIRLRAESGSAASFEEVTLSGSYPGGNGVTLQVQRREGGSWASFPTSATVDGGRFSTFVASGQTGPNAFRVVDPATGETSNVVVFTVG
jgi:hypothetical protein